MVRHDLGEHRFNAGVGVIAAAVPLGKAHAHDAVHEQFGGAVVSFPGGSDETDSTYRGRAIRRVAGFLTNQTCHGKEAISLE